MSATAHKVCRHTQRAVHAVVLRAVHWHDCMIASCQWTASPGIPVVVIVFVVCCSLAAPDTRQQGIHTVVLRRLELGGIVSGNVDYRFAQR